MQNPAARLPAFVLLAGFGVLMVVEHGLPSRTTWLPACVAVQTALVTGLLVLNPGWSVLPILFFVLSVDVMLNFGRRTGLIWIGIFAVITALAFIFYNGVATGLLATLPYAAGYLFFGVFGSALAEAEAARRQSQELLNQLSEREAALRSAHEQLQRYAAQAESVPAVAQERERMSCEMHDTIGHRLTVAAVQLEGAERLIPSDPERAARMIGTVREQVRSALSQFRACRLSTALARGRGPAAAAGDAQPGAQLHRRHRHRRPRANLF